MNKKILALFLVVAMVCSLFVCPALADDANDGIMLISANTTFPDVPGTWAEASIDRWSAAGVINGDHAGNFNPGNTITRAELAQVLVNLLGLTDKADADTFTDVKAGDWFADAVLKCAAAGIMKGNGTGLANPNSPITRQEAIVMIGRALGVKPSTDTNLKQFADGETVADWAAGYMAPLTKMGILNGIASANGDVNVLPELNIDRASTVALLDKAIGQYVTNAGTVKADDANKFVVVKAPEGEVTVTGEAAGVTVAIGNAADVKLDNVITDTVKVDAPVKVNLTSGTKVGDLTLNAPAKVQNDGTVGTVDNNVPDATFDGNKPGKIENAEGVDSLKDSNGKDVDKSGVIVVPSGGGSSSGGTGIVTTPAVANVQTVFVTEENYDDYADLFGAKPEWDIHLPWLLVKYNRNEAGTVEFTVTKDGAAVQFGTVAEGETEPTLTSALSVEAEAANTNAWVSFHMVSQAETDHKGQTWLNQADPNGAYVVTVKLNGATAASTAKTYPETEEPGPDDPGHEAVSQTLWIVGDSTVCDFGDKDKTLYYPRFGYGTQVGNYLDDCYTVKNLALSGTSSKSFLTEANYATLFGADGIKEGDALIIGFGHNDEKAEADRYTNPNGTWETEGSFAKSLWDNYVKPAQDKGAEVILCTPIVRRNNSALSDANCHITADATDSDGNSYPGGNYPAAIKALGDAKSVPVVDLTALTKALYEELTPTETVNLHSWGNSDKGSVDNTHLNIYGAKVVAWTLVNALKDGDTALAGHLDLTAGEPTKANDLVSNPEYVESDYEPPTTTSTNWQDFVVGDVHFKGTVFGQLGGDSVMNPSNYTIETQDGNMHLVGANNKSKIQSADDGLIMYYYQIPAGKQVELSAKATVNSLTAHNQAAFGLMARDDMYVDLAKTGLNSDYVAAGAFTQNARACWYRKSTTLTKGSENLVTVTAGQSYDLKIVSNTDGYACTFNDQTYTQGFDFALNTVDTQYYYVGMFVSRNMDVTYSDIVLKVDGEVLVDTTSGSNTTDEITLTVTPYDFSCPAGSAQYITYTLKNGEADFYIAQDTVAKCEFRYDRQADGAWTEDTGVELFTSSTGDFTGMDKAHQLGWTVSRRDAASTAYWRFTGKDGKVYLATFEVPAKIANPDNKTWGDTLITGSVDGTAIPETTPAP